MTRSVLIVGAGIVGICCGLALQQQGYRITLLDRDAPGGKASRWNAGMFATSSLYPLCNPAIPAQVLRLLTGRVAGFRLSPRAIRQAVPWGAKFLAQARNGKFEARVAALHDLISLSRGLHETQLRDAGATALLQTGGWLMLHESAAAFAGTQALRDACDRHDVAWDMLSPEALHTLEPHLSPATGPALFFPGSASVTDPHLLVQAYLRLFLARGGKLQQGQATAIDGTGVVLDTGTRLEADRLVIAAGPWSATLLASVNRRLPMISERGYLARLSLADGAQLSRPVCDASAGIVLSPRPDGVQVATGTELTTPDIPNANRQMAAALRRARRLLPLSPDAPAIVSADRPTLPDSLPAIGRLPGAPDIWLCCGHQHVGFSTSAGSAAVLAALMSDIPAPIRPAPFDPARFGL